MGIKKWGYDNQKGAEERKKILILTHGSDVDGIGCLILARLAFGGIDYELFSNNSNLEEKFKIYCEKGSLRKYTNIFITDLALFEPLLSIVNDDPTLKKKVRIFDHHQGAIDRGCAKYDFAHIIVKDDNGLKKCGTQIFYEYLVKNGYLTRSQIRDEFVELTRLEEIPGNGRIKEILAKRHTTYHCY